MRREGAAAQTFLELDVGGRRFALPEESVVRVVRSVAVVPLPNAPEVISGAIRYEGDVLPVLDLRTRLFGTHAEIELTDHFVVAQRAGGKKIALHTNRAVSLLTLEANVVSSGNESDRAVTGLVSLEDGLLLVLDVERFLTHAEDFRTNEALASFLRDGAP